MARRKTKYTLRADGRVEMVKVMPNGKRRHFYGHSDAEVESKYEVAKAKAEKQETRKVRLFKQVAEDWWEVKEPKLSPNTITGYKTAMTRAVNEFGEMAVDEVTTHMIISYLSRFSAKGYSQKVINNSKSVLKKILDSALIAGEIGRNPCKDLPQIEGKAKVRRQPASSADLQLIEQHKNDSDIARMYYFMVYTGLRRGEAAALQYKHINRESQTVHVVQSCAWMNSKPVIKEPKTEAGKRTVELVDNALDVIPEGRNPEEYVFFPAGLPKRREIEGGLERYRRDTGVSATPHQLRHSYASLLHSAGIDVKDAQTLLGHSTVAMTQDIYTHLEQEHKKEVQSKLNSYVKERRLSSKLSSNP